MENSPKQKSQTVVIQVIESEDSLFIQILTFLSALSFIFLAVMIVLVFWARPEGLESVSRPIRELLQSWKGAAVEQVLPVGPRVQASSSAETHAVPTPQAVPAFMTADEVLKENDLTQSQLIADVNPQTVIEDPLNRISVEFKVPESLKKRVAFWLSVYTQHSSLVHLIHHDRYPWIVFETVDTTSFMSTKGPEWLRRERGKQYAKNRLSLITKTLRDLSRRTQYNNLSPLEADLYERLRQLPGPRTNVFRLASMSVRSQLGQRDFFLAGLRNSARYLTYMEEEFRKRNLPTELTRLPFVESSFNEKAESKVGASGIWQIMPRTGKAYLIVNNDIDERNAPLKATRVAAYIFKTYNHVLKSWPLTITSYNHGIGNIQIAIRRANSHDLPTIIDRYHDGDFKFASSNFFTCFLAALHAEKYQEVLFPSHSKQGLKEREVVFLDRPLRVDRVSELAGISSDQLLDFNLDLKHAISRKAYLPKGFELHLPKGAREKLMASLENVTTLRTRREARDTTQRPSPPIGMTSKNSGST